MSRHTLSDGITPDKEITEASFDTWWRELAPPVILIGSYYKRRLLWEIFEKEYVQFLKLPNIKAQLLKLIEFSKNSNVTILCTEKTPDKCHRRIIAETCKEIDPLLEIDIQ